MSVNHFGPGVIGAEAAAANRKIEESEADRFGPGVLNNAPARPKVQTPAPDSEEADDLASRDPAPAVVEFTALSIPALEKELATNPARFDELYRGEFMRPGGARKGALGVFLSVEQATTNRPEVIEALVGMLAAPK
jgi:hypothetical protein